MLKFFITTFKWAKLNLHPILGQLVVLLPCLVSLNHLVPLSCSSYFPLSFLLLVMVFICLKWLVFSGSFSSFVFSCVLELGMAKLKCSKTCVQEFALKRLSSWACVSRIHAQELAFQLKNSNFSLTPSREPWPKPWSSCCLAPLFWSFYSHVLVILLLYIIFNIQGGKTWSLELNQELVWA